MPPITHAPSALDEPNLNTIDAVRAIHDLGLQHSVALVGIDHVALADVVAPGVPVIAQDPGACGALPRSCCSRAWTASAARRARSS